MWCCSNTSIGSSAHANQSTSCDICARHAQGLPLVGPLVAEARPLHHALGSHFLIQCAPWLESFFSLIPWARVVTPSFAFTGLKNTGSESCSKAESWSKKLQAGLNIIERLKRGTTNSWKPDKNSQDIFCLSSLGCRRNRISMACLRVAKIAKGSKRQEPDARTPRCNYCSVTWRHCLSKNAIKVAAWSWWQRQSFLKHSWVGWKTLRYTMYVDKVERPITVENVDVCRRSVTPPPQSTWMLHAGDPAFWGWCIANSIS